MNESENNSILSDNHVDDHVDSEIQQCLSSVPPQSFFMFAGAGSGKTRSLINTLQYLDKEKGASLAEQGKQIAVITYTNAACDEINRRLQYKSIFLVSTIHSFLWELIKHFQADIKAWIRNSVENEISELQEKQKKGKRGQASITRAEQIVKKQERLEKIINVHRFSYNPNGNNMEYDSLSHEEVIKMGAEFIATEETMQQILVRKFPILLIDESQDTKKELIDSFLAVYNTHKTHGAIGMFGDTMQKVYSDGKDNLEEIIPREWAFPEKVMNHRSSKKIVALANSIRKISDDKEQRPRSDAKEGDVRLFIADSSQDKGRTERRAAEMMAKLTCDTEWDEDSYQCLILEHHMAASRFSFERLFTPLYQSDDFKNAVRKGEIAELAFLSNVISPLIAAYKARDDFGVAKILKNNSPLLNKKSFEKCDTPETQKSLLDRAERATQSLFSLWDHDEVPSCIDILRNIYDSGLFKLNDRVEDILSNDEISANPKINILKKALSASFDELERYSAYVSEQTRFATHQGVKGLEYPRVMVIIDDSDAKGFLFSYEKLFGAVQQTETDKKNERAGKDTSIKRTARLFYVACTRAMDSLAVVVYSSSPDTVRRTAMSKGWFSEDEIVMMDIV